MGGMTTTGIFTTAQHNITVAGSGIPHRIIIWGDVHRDAPLCAVDRWKEFLDYCKSLRNATYLGMGDYMDMLSTSERVTLAGELHESTRDSLDDLADVDEASPAEGDVLTYSGTAWVGSQPNAANPGASIDTLGSNSEGSETAATDTWTSGGTNGLALWQTCRVVYNEAGDEKLYEFRRKLTFDKSGRLYSVSGETRIEVDAPGDC